MMVVGSIIGSVIGLVFKNFGINTGVAIETLTSDNSIIGSVVLALCAPIFEELYELKLSKYRTYLMWVIKQVDDCWAFCALGDSFEGDEAKLLARFGVTD